LDSEEEGGTNFLHNGNYTPNDTS